MKNNILKKTGKTVSFILIPALNFKSLIKSYKSFKSTFLEVKNKYNEDKKLINRKDNDDNGLKKYSSKDLKKIEIINRTTLLMLLLLIIYVCLQFDENLIVSLFKLLPIFIILLFASFSLSYLHFVFKNKKRIMIKEFIKEVKSNIFLLVP